jgi:hypothetical protein
MNGASVLRALSIALALVAVVCMIRAIAGMVTGDQTPRHGFVLRLAAVVCFGGAVALNVVVH